MDAVFVPSKGQYLSFSNVLVKTFTRWPYVLQGKTGCLFTRKIFDHRLSTAKVASFPFSSVVKFCVAFLFMIDGYLATNMNITCTYDVIGEKGFSSGRCNELTSLGT